MKKSVLASVVLAGALSSSAFAYQGNGMPNNCPQQGNMQQAPMQGMMAGKKMDCGMQMMGAQSMRGHMKKGSNMMLAFSKLNLTDEQQYKISLLRDEMRLEMKKAMGMRNQAPMFKFVSNNGFDAAGYKKYMGEKSQKMMSLRADYMKKMFDVLTKEQRQQLIAKK